jgi:hypothetical protein
MGVPEKDINPDSLLFQHLGIDCGEIETWLDDEFHFSPSDDDRLLRVSDLAKYIDEHAKRAAV